MMIIDLLSAIDGEGMWAVMPTVYIASLVLGGGLLMFSVAAGGDADGADAGDLGDVDIDLDVDADADGDLFVDGAGDSAFGLSTWLSLRFGIFFLAIMGGIGTALVFMTDVAPPWIAIVAGGAGIVGGQVVQQLFRIIKKTGGNSATRHEDYVDRAARVSVAVAPGRTGEVSAEVARAERFIPAMARRSDDSFEVGDRVVIVAYNNGVAEVISREEYEFVANSTPGGTHEHVHANRTSK